ncbi:MAG: serine protease [Granulosicoccus sp.]
MDAIDKTVDALKKAIDDFDVKAVAGQSQQLMNLMELHLAEHPERFCQVLAEAADRFDYGKVTELCNQLTTHLQCRDIAYPDKAANDILHILQRKRRFSEMLTVADLFMRIGSVDPTIKRRYAQALIDSGHYSAAENVLMLLCEECSALCNQKELSQAQGLLGRLYKQTYVNAAARGQLPGDWARQTLKRSFDCYHAVYVNDAQQIWHGINAVAVWHRAKKDGIDLSVSDMSAQTSAILDLIAVPGDVAQSTGTKKRTDMWAMATAAEACLAKEDYQSALGWLDKYIDESHARDNKSDAFEVASTLRQFEELWQLDDKNVKHSRILQVLRGALLRRKGGSIALDNPQTDLETIDGLLDDDSFEAVFGQERFKNLKWLKAGFERAQGVCKITDRFGEAFGTGFIMRAEDLHLNVAQSLVVLTNAHVVSNDATEQRGSPKAKSADKVKVQFEAADDPERAYEVERILATSSRHELDFSILALKEPIPFDKPYPVAKSLPLVGEDQRIYLIGHPRGGRLSFSLYDNLLLDHEPPKLHYRSPSLGGSSGSPVFNQDWDLIGLHHAGGEKMPRLNDKEGTYSANEGLWIASIIAAVESKACLV